VPSALFGRERSRLGAYWYLMPGPCKGSRKSSLRAQGGAMGFLATAYKCNQGSGLLACVKGPAQEYSNLSVKGGKLGSKKRNRTRKRMDNAVATAVG